MRFKRRAPGIEHRPATTMKGYEHLEAGSIAVLRWLMAHRVDFVLIGPLAQAIRGEQEARGPVAIVPAPYHRNYARLARALAAAHARQRTEATSAGQTETVPIKVSAGQLAEGRRLRLRCGAHDIDIEPVKTTDGSDRDAGRGYQELIYESTRCEPAHGVAVEVASPEDIEHYAHVARTGAAPKIRISRAEPAVQQPG